MDWTYELIVTFIIFLILFGVGKYIKSKLENSESRFLNPHEYLPEDEIQTLKQVFYLIMMLILFVFLLYTIVTGGNDYTGLAFLEIIITTYVALTLDYSIWKIELPHRIDDGDSQTKIIKKNKFF